MHSDERFYCPYFDNLANFTDKKCKTFFKFIEPLRKTVKKRTNCSQIFIDHRISLIAAHNAVSESVRKSSAQCSSLSAIVWPTIVGSSEFEKLIRKCLYIYLAVIYAALQPAMGFSNKLHPPARGQKSWVQLNNVFIMPCNARRG